MLWKGGRGREGWGTEGWDEEGWEEEGCAEDGYKEEGRETGNKTSQRDRVRNLGNSPRVPESVMWRTEVPPTHRDERRTRPTHVRMMSLLSMAVVPEAGVRSGKGSGRRAGLGATNSCVRLRSASLQKLSDVSRSDCVRLPTCSRSLDSSRSSSTSST
ncbi:hypothetical protein MHU86_16485 [Fragilaria crotonensis]|nr:hypothetical protein MHU86_16485 [Fragilaria crotonensis]